MGTNINMQFVSQLGEGANMHNNDCGPACTSMIILKATDTFVSPDQLYKLPGWGAPSIDIGTNADQLQAVLHLFNVNSEKGNSLTVPIIKTLIDNGYPLITLVKYGLFSDAGLTIKKGSFNHWLVVTGYTNTEIITMDPYRPFENGGTMIVPNTMFINSYLGSYLKCLIDGTEANMYNATVNNFAGLNIRASLPISSTTLGVDIGDLAHQQRIRLKEPIVDHLGKDGLTWVELELPTAGWVAKKYLIIDPIAPPPPVQDDKAARLEEISLLEAYCAKRRSELQNS